MPSDDLLTREEVLTGLPAKRASTLLFLIESRTAHRVARSQLATAPIPTEERDLAFLEAFALGRQPPLRPTIQHLERHAPQWAYLAPEDPQTRAAIAHLLGQKYVFSYQAVPGIRTALGLDTEAVQQAYQHLYQQPLANVFTPRLKPVDRLRWGWAALGRWLEALPPFWTALAISLPLGAYTLALPIAVADVGPLVGVALVVLLGIINILTIAAISEAVARSGIIRYGNAFLGRVVTDYLGSIGSFIFTSVLGGIFFMLMLVFYIGVATTLADATSIPAEAWTALLFLVGLYFLSRRSFSATVASTLITRALTVGLLLILSVLAFAHLRTENLAYVKLPFVGGRPFEPALLQLIFGTILSIYIAHPAVGNIATITLRRDPSGRSLIWGNVASIVITTIISSIWILAMNGAIAPQTLAGQSGTVLGPLATVAGPSVHVLGSLLAILSMGMGSIIISLGLFYLVREWLPARLPKSVSMSPVVIAFVLAEWLLLTNGESFAGLISFLGVIATSLLGGIFPVLLLVASRRKGEVVPGVVYRFLGHPWLIAGIYFLFLAVLFVHGLLLWQNPLERVGALLVGIVMLAATVLMVRRGAFTPRVVVELREDQREQEQATFAITAAGQPATAEVWLGYPDGEHKVQAATGKIPAFSSLRYANFHLLTPQAQELKVWAHRITPEGDSESLPALLEVHCGDSKQQFDLRLSGEQVVLPLSNETCRVGIIFD